MSLPTPFYQDPMVTLYHGDCREILPLLPKVDAVITDPPYGIGEASGKNKSRFGLVAPTDYGGSDWDDTPIDWPLMQAVIRTAPLACIWGGNYYPVPPSPSWLVWDKVNYGSGFADCELAWTNFGCAVRKIRHQWNGMLREGKEARFHPTQKPLELMKWCITLAKVPEGGLILDPFAGSGTTLRAAKDLGRRSIGIEIDEKYCRIIAARMRQEVLALDFGDGPSR